MQGFNFPHGSEPSSVGRNLFGGPDQTDSPRKGTAAAAQPDLRRGLADLKAASADGSLRRACLPNQSDSAACGIRWQLAQPRFKSALKWCNAALFVPDMIGSPEHVSTVKQAVQDLHAPSGRADASPPMLAAQGSCNDIRAYDDQPDVDRLRQMEAALAGLPDGSVNPEKLARAGEALAALRDQLTDLRAAEIVLCPKARDHFPAPRFIQQRTVLLRCPGLHLLSAPELSHVQGATTDSAPGTERVHQCGAISHDMIRPLGTHSSHQLHRLA